MPAPKYWLFALNTFPCKYVHRRLQSKFEQTSLDMDYVHTNQLRVEKKAEAVPEELFEKKQVRLLQERIISMLLMDTTSLAEWHIYILARTQPVSFQKLRHDLKNCYSSFLVLSGICFRTSKTPKSFPLSWNLDQFYVLWLFFPGEFYCWHHLGNKLAWWNYRVLALFLKLRKTVVSEGSQP